MKRWEKRWDGYVTVEMAQRLMPPCVTAVDVGCGIQPCQYLIAARHFAVEPHAPYHEKAKAAVIHPLHILHGTWKECRHEVKELRPDVILALDVIEHMDKADGQCFLADLADIATQGAAVFTPYGFKEQKYEPGQPDAWGMDGQHWQTHRSGWMPDEFGGWHTVISESESSPGVTDRTILAILDKSGFMERPLAQIILGRGFDL